MPEGAVKMLVTAVISCEFDAAGTGAGDDDDEFNMGLSLAAYLNI